MLSDLDKRGTVTVENFWRWKVEWETHAGNARDTERLNVPTATGAAPSGGAPVGAVTALAACPAQNVAGLAVTSSAGAGDLVDAARTYVSLYERWWSSLMRGPYNGTRDAAHWDLVHERQVAWQRYADLLRMHGLVPPDRRAFAKALALGGVA